MSADESRYKCPMCRALIFNRRWPKCEKCGHELPEDLLYSPEQATAHDEELKMRLSKRGAVIGGSETGGLVGEESCWSFDIGSCGDCGD